MGIMRRSCFGEMDDRDQLVIFELFIRNEDGAGNGFCKINLPMESQFPFLNFRFEFT